MQTKPKIKTVINPTKEESGAAAAKLGAKLIRDAIKKNGKANIIVATGASQFEMLGCLILEKGIDWTKVTAFHLDEYVGTLITHPASFRKYLWERFVSRLPLPLSAFHYISGEGDALAECKRVGAIIAKHPIDVCFAGIGENGHLAFNDQGPLSRGESGRGLPQTTDGRRMVQNPRASAQAGHLDVDPANHEIRSHHLHCAGSSQSPSRERLPHRRSLIDAPGLDHAKPSLGYLLSGYKIRLASVKNFSV